MLNTSNLTHQPWLTSRVVLGLTAFVLTVLVPGLLIVANVTTDPHDTWFFNDAILIPAANVPLVAFKNGHPSIMIESATIQMALMLVTCLIFQIGAGETMATLALAAPFTAAGQVFGRWNNALTAAGRPAFARPRWITAG